MAGRICGSTFSLYPAPKPPPGVAKEHLLTDSGASSQVNSRSPNKIRRTHTPPASVALNFPVSQVEYDDPFDLASSRTSIEYRCGDEQRPDSGRNSPQISQRGNASLSDASTVYGSSCLDTFDMEEPVSAPRYEYNTDAPMKLLDLPVFTHEALNCPSSGGNESKSSNSPKIIQNSLPLPYPPSMVPHLTTDKSARRGCAQTSRTPQTTIKTDGYGSASTSRARETPTWPNRLRGFQSKTSSAQFIRADGTSGMPPKSISAPIMTPICVGRSACDPVLSPGSGRHRRHTDVVEHIYFPKGQAAPTSVPVLPLHESSLASSRARRPRVAPSPSPRQSPTLNFQESASDAGPISSWDTDEEDNEEDDGFNLVRRMKTSLHLTNSHVIGRTSRAPSAASRAAAASSLAEKERVGSVHRRRASSGIGNMFRGAVLCGSGNSGGR